jgi:hypothetical protein
MHSLCSSQNKEERTTDSQYRHPLPHQRDTQTAHPQSYTSSPADETSLQMSSSSMSSVIHPHIQENVVTHFTTFTTDINSQSGHSTNLNNSRTLESQQKIQRLYPSDVRIEGKTKLTKLFIYLLVNWNLIENCGLSL